MFTSKHIGTRAIALVALLSALWLMVDTGTATLLAWTDRVFPVTRYPALFTALFATWLGAAMATTPQRRRLALLVGSLATGVIFDPWFVAGTVAWLAPFHIILFSSARYRVRWAFGFVLASTAALTIVCNRDWWPAFLVEHADIPRWGYVAAASYTFRLAWLLHQVRVQRTAWMPFGDLVTYFVFAPFFVIVPYMIAIPRCDRFCAGLERHDLATERSGMRMVAFGAVLTLALALVSRTYDPMTASLEAVRDRDYATALVHGLLYYPPQVIVKAVAIGSILVGLVRVLGIDLGPSFVRPELSRSITEWWRRWNVHFRELLVDIFYYPIVMRWRRSPIKATVLGCAAVFLIGSPLFHWPKTYFAAGSLWTLPAGTITEDAVMFIVVTLVILREQRLGPAVQPRRLLGLFTTWLIVFFTVVLVGYSTTAYWNTHISPRSPLPQLQPRTPHATTR